MRAWQEHAARGGRRSRGRHGLLFDSARKDIGGVYLQLVAVRHTKLGRQAERVELGIAGDAVGGILIEGEPPLHAPHHLGALEDCTEDERDEEDRRHVIEPANKE